MRCIHGIHHTQPCMKCNPGLTRIYLCSCGEILDPAEMAKKGFMEGMYEMFDHIGHGHMPIKMFPEGTLVIMED